MDDRNHKHHPMQDAEDALIALGFKHAPIQGFTEGSEIDNRLVCTFDAPGAYYILGWDNNQRNHNTIQLLFWNIECQDIQIGWKVLKTEELPVEGEGKMISVLLELPDGR